MATYNWDIYMNTRLRCLIIFILGLAWILPSTPALAAPRNLPPLQEETPTSPPSIPSPADIINAVNNLRLQHGLNPLTVHAVLMEVAAEQANALAAT